MEDEGCCQAEIEHAIKSDMFQINALRMQIGG